ncbi:MAG: NeuD/PglB/VioB family sugar acetyltransferase [Kiritimatiellae bacterium]|nr:NeuD/PglB/VioB family sugar acetyltransferase [Kiritimatiellia bacterium]
MNDVMIYGAGSVGRMAEQIIFDINQARPTWRVLGFLDDNPSTHGSSIAGLPVMGGIDYLDRIPSMQVIPAFGKPTQRQAAALRLRQNGRHSLATLIHPQAWIARRVEIGEGSMIYPGVHVDVDVRIGRQVLMNKLCTIGHDTVIGDYSTVGPGVNIGGHNSIGEGVDLGINSATIQDLCIGAWSQLGAGAVAVRNMDSHKVYIGVPARVLRSV